MSVTNPYNTILDADVQVKSCDRETKVREVASYHIVESATYAVVIPTQNLILHFQDTIGYASPATSCCGLRGNQWHTWQQLANLYVYPTWEAARDHLMNPQKQYWLVKLTREAGIYKLYVYERSNLQQARHQLLTQWGIEETE